jgi:hypothetical protein
MDPDDELRLRVLRHERVIRVDGCGPIEAHSVLLFEIDEEHAHLARLRHVPHRHVHPVAVVVREGYRLLVDHAHKARFATLVGAVGVAVGVDRGKEEHVQGLDELPVILRDEVVDDTDEPVGHAGGVELLLELALVRSVFVGHGQLREGNVRECTRCSEQSVKVLLER